MTDPEIERMTLCIAQMAATLEAGDRANPSIALSIEELADGGWYSPKRYVDRARRLYESAVQNVAGKWPS